MKTVLLKVRVPHDREGAEPVATVELAYRDLVSDSDGHCGGKLGLEVVPNSADASDLDPVVSGRAQRSETAAVLKDANGLFEQGQGDEAPLRRLASREESLRGAAEKARRAARRRRAPRPSTATSPDSSPRSTKPTTTSSPRSPRRQPRVPPQQRPPRCRRAAPARAR